jgi:aerobic-type carbon monoxide dehydrogenase small subunit (CoxS/CutS family)
MTRVASAVGKRVRTIEGLADDGQLDPVQQAFLDHEAYQCGFCTPGMIIEACGFLATLDGRIPEKDEVQRALRRHICRCGSYQRIVAAVVDAAARKSRSPV